MHCWFQRLQALNAPLFAHWPRTHLFWGGGVTDLKSWPTNGCLGSQVWTPRDHHVTLDPRLQLRSISARREWSDKYETPMLRANQRPSACLAVCQLWRWCSAHHETIFPEPHCLLLSKGKGAKVRHCNNIHQAKTNTNGEKPQGACTRLNLGGPCVETNPEQTQIYWPTLLDSGRQKGRVLQPPAPWMFLRSPTHSAGMENGRKRQHGMAGFWCLAPSRQVPMKLTTSLFLLSLPERKQDHYCCVLRIYITFIIEGRPPSGNDIASHGAIQAAVSWGHQQLKSVFSF